MTTCIEDWTHFVKELQIEDEFGTMFDHRHHLLLKPNSLLCECACGHSVHDIIDTAITIKVAYTTYLFLRSTLPPHEKDELKRKACLYLPQ